MGVEGRCLCLGLGVLRLIQAFELLILSFVPVGWCFIVILYFLLLII